MQASAATIPCSRCTGLRCLLSSCLACRQSASFLQPKVSIHTDQAVPASRPGSSACWKGTMQAAAVVDASSC